MRSSSWTALALSTAPIFANALPLFSRQPSATDLLVFQFANVLEQLETEFYTQAIAKFQVQDFLDAGYVNADIPVQQLQAIAKDEQTHTSALQSAITSFGADPIICQFDFTSVLTNVATTMAVARVVELVGVGAYIGGAGLLDDPRFLTTAATILTTEARHQTILNVLNGGAAAGLQSFDIPLRPEQVLAIAGGFITGDCNLGITANDPLTVTNNGTIAAGTLLTFQSKGISNANGKDLFCNMIIGGATDAISLPIDQCVVPAGIQGPVALFITDDDQPLLASDITDQDTKCIVSGPAITFLDFGVAEQALAQVVLTPQSPLNKDLTGLDGVQSQSCPNGQSCTAVASDSTSTISPDQASTIAGSGEQPSNTVAPSPDISTVAPSASATTVGNAPALPTTDLFGGDVVPVMPTPAAPSAGSASTDSVAINAATPTVGSDGLPLPSDATVPASGAGSSGDDSGVIVPLVPGASASAGASASSPAADGGDIAVLDPNASSSSTAAASAPASTDIVPVSP